VEIIVKIFENSSNNKERSESEKTYEINCVYILKEYLRLQNYSGFSKKYNAREIIFTKIKEEEEGIFILSNYL